MMHSNEQFVYDSNTGVLTHAKNKQSIKKGQRVGYFDKKKMRWRATINYKSVHVEWLIWELVNGPIPKEKVIDHIDGDPSNNKLDNLRLVDHKTNLRNAGLTKGKKIIGVRWDRNKWRAEMTLNKNKRVLDFRTDDYFEACCRRKASEVKHGFHENHGKRPSISSLAHG